MHGMSVKKDPLVLMSPLRRLIYGIVIAGLAVAVLGAATLVVFEGRNVPPDQGTQVQGKPFLPSQQPEGWPKTTGRVFGVLAATLLFFQFGLSSKPKPLDRVFGLHRVLHLHRILGPSLVILASLHPLFMFVSDPAGIGPLRLAIWPELLGILLLICLWTGVCVALWRRFLAVPYQEWYLMHRFAMFSAVGIFTLHVWNVTDDFHRRWPLYALAAVILLYAALLAWKIILKPVFLKKQPYTVTRVRRVAEDVHEVEMVPDKGEMFSYAPGQFAFVTFFSEGLTTERHHWTLSSSPTRPKSCMFTIKCSGDFTSLIGRLKTGDQAAVDGPYGLFSHLAHQLGVDTELVMVAGGIGITPMLSMLRYMADTDDRRKVTLVWSNRTEEHILYREELEGIKGKGPELAIHHVLTREQGFRGQTGRLNLQTLKELLAGCSRDAAVFVCGPPPMMTDVCRNMRGLGFKRSHIYREKFSY
jgi:predicted ferric reductase